MSIQNRKYGHFVIKDFTAVTSLGFDSATSFASFRAGLSRAQPIDSIRTFNIETGDIEQLTVHPVDLITRGFEGAARLSRLLQYALAALQNKLKQTDNKRARLSFYLSLPSISRTQSLYDTSEDSASSDTIVSLTGDPEKNAEERKYCNLLLTKAAKWANWRLSTSVAFHTNSEYTGVSEALLFAMKDLEDHVIDTAIVGGVDSLIDEKTVGWLRNTNRLKNADTPAGLMPGEGSALFVVERPHEQSNDFGPATALVSQVCLEKEAYTFASEEAPLGIGLSKAVFCAMNRVLEQINGRFWAICDQNGEDNRAIEWGNALVHLLSYSSAFTNPILWLPAAGFGDTAAASGALAICSALQAYQRGYAPADHVVVCSSSLTQLRSAVLLSRL
jgi:3-oxoacyl-[acyl-carrier-protein] synthase-1